MGNDQLILLFSMSDKYIKTSTTSRLEKSASPLTTNHIANSQVSNNFGCISRIVKSQIREGPSFMGFKYLI